MENKIDQYIQQSKDTLEDIETDGNNGQSITYAILALVETLRQDKQENICKCNERVDKFFAGIINKLVLDRLGRL